MLSPAIKSEKILVIADGPIGNEIWSMPMLNSLTKAGHKVDVVTSGFKHDIYPADVSLFSKLDDVDLTRYDRVIVRKGPQGSVPEGRWKNQAPALNDLPYEKLIEIPYNEGWKECSYQTINDCDIANLTQAASPTRAYLNIVEEELGAKPAPASKTPLYERLTEDQKIDAVEKLASVVDNDGPLVMIYGKTSDIKKNYPEEKWYEVAQQLADSGARVVFMGASGDPETTDEDNKIGSLVGKLSLGQGYYLMHTMASLVLAADTHACHGAAEVGTPSLTIFGGSTISELVAAYGDSSYVITSKEETPANIDSSEVANAAIKLLEEYPLRQRFLYFKELA